MAEDNSTSDALRQLAARLEHLERVLQMHTERLYGIERQLGLTFRPPAVEPSRRPLYESFTDERNEGALSPQQAEPSTHTASTIEVTHAAGARETGSATMAAAATSRANSEGAQAGDGAAHNSHATDAGTARTARRDVESIVGGSWFNWIGIIAITFGVAFFLKYAFESQIIGPLGRVALGGVAGLGFLAAGETLRKRGLRQYAYVLSGGGILILYLSVYAAREFYKLIEQPPAFLLMAVVTGAAVLLAARYNALPIAVLGLIGGFLTPLLLSTGQDNQTALFTYIALLDAGVLTLAYFKSWRSLNFMAFFATVLMLTGWAFSFYETPKLWLTLFFLTVFFLLFSLLAIAHNVLAQRPARWFDISLIILNATFYFSVSYALMAEAGYVRATGAFADTIAGFFLFLFFVVWSRHREDRLLGYSYLGAAITFLTIALAIQLEQQWVTIGWAMEGLMLTWSGLRTRQNAPRHAALFVFTIALAHWFGWDLSSFDFRGHADTFVPLLNRRAVSCAVLVATLAASAWLYRRAGEGAEDVAAHERELMSSFLILAANLLAFVLLTFDINDYFLHPRVGVALDRARLENTHQFSLSALWTLYGTATLLIGVKSNLKALRYVALLLLAGATAKVLMFDLWYYAAAWHVPLVNQTFMAFVLLVCAYLFAARLYERAATIDAHERAIVPTLVVIANVLAIVSLSAEASGYFASKMTAVNLEAGRLMDLRLAQQLSLSVIWATYGGVMFIYGRARDRRMLRLLALGLLVLTTLKVFFLDLSSLERVYRIISFIVLGAILLAVSYLYQKTQQQQRESA